VKGGDAARRTEAESFVVLPFQDVANGEIHLLVSAHFEGSHNQRHGCIGAVRLSSTNSNHHAWNNSTY
jgi:hypothetical protein